MADGKPVAVLVRGDHEVQEVKLKNMLGVVDVEEDFNLLTEIYNKFYKGKIISIKSVIKFLDQNPNLAKINFESEKKQREKNLEENIKQKII